MPFLLLVIALVLGIVVVMAYRANTLFVITVRDGECEITKGHVPGVLLGRIREVVRLGRVRDAKIVARRGRDHAEIHIRPMDENTAQRLRNVMGTHPISAFRATPESPWVKRLKWLLGVSAMSWLLGRLMR